MVDSADDEKYNFLRFEYQNWCTYIALYNRSRVSIANEQCFWIKILKIETWFNIDEMSITQNEKPSWFKKLIPVQVYQTFMIKYLL